MPGNQYPIQTTPLAATDYQYYDHLIHDRLSDGSEVILFPITRYEALMGAPKVVEDMETFHGAPFFFYQTDEVDVDRALIEQMIGISMSPE